MQVFVITGFQCGTGDKTYHVWPIIQVQSITVTNRFRSDRIYDIIADIVLEKRFSQVLQ